MMLKIKEEYLEYSIGGGKVKLTKLKNLNQNQYEKYFNMGFKDFFEIIEEEIIINDNDGEYDIELFLNEIKTEEEEDDIN